MTEKQWLNMNDNITRVDRMVGSLASHYGELNEKSEEYFISHAISLLMKIDERAGVYERTKAMEDVRWTYNSN